MSALNVRTIAESTYFDHARSYLEPCVFSTWKQLQANLVRILSQRDGAILGGDMRADSPGHCAKYGSYTMMDLNNGNVIDIQLVQVRFYNTPTYTDRYEKGCCIDNV